MDDSFILDYSILVFFAACGVFQIAAACNGLRGLLLLADRRLSFMVGLVLLVAAFSWFFLSEPRNVSDSGQGMNGNEQFGYFFAGSGAALLFTLLVSSWRNRSLGTRLQHSPPGVDALREINYLRALHLTLRDLLAAPSSSGRRAGGGWMSRWKRSSS